MQDESDSTEADRIHEGYQQRYKKERKASYALATFGLLAFVAVGVLAFMNHMNYGAANYASYEPGEGFSTGAPDR
jgi:hypothetical protein